MNCVYQKNLDFWAVLMDTWYAILVWVRLKQVALETHRTIYRVKHDLLDDYFGRLFTPINQVTRRSNVSCVSLIFNQIKERFPRLKLVWADAAYAGKLVEWAKQFYHWVLEIVKRTDDMKGFVLLPHRWVVERTFGWLNRWRRLSKDYEPVDG